MLDPLQRPDLLLEATAHVVRQEPRVRLLVVVTNSAQQHLQRFRRRTAELGLGDRVVLTEPQPLAALPNVLSAGDVAVAPRPQTAGMSVKLLNYMAVRRPSVLFASSTTNGLVHRENAMLAAPDTGEALGEAILEVLRDGELRGRLAQNGHRFVREHHDRRQAAQLIYGAYLRTLAAAGRLPPTQPGEGIGNGCLLRAKQ
jgi:glycosyltransferase involved in cell wall biosynthesis